MASNVHIVNNTGVSNINGSQPQLHDGSVVKGRVLSQNGSNSYTISVAGQKIDVQSRVPLKEGAVFSARLGVEGNVLTIRLLNQSQSASVLTKLSSQGFDPGNKALVNLLNSLGLPVTQESFRLLQFAIGLGIKPQNPKIYKSIIRSQDDEGNIDEEKAQVNLLMEDKKLGSTDRAVDKISGKRGRNSEKNSDRNQAQDQQENRFDSETPVSAEEVKAYFDSVKNASETHEGGELTLFNSVKGQESKGHWVVLPFEWDFKNFIGVIRVFLVDGEKNLQKVHIECSNATSKYKFVIYFDGNTVDRIKFAVDGKASVNSSETLRKRLHAFINQAQFNLESDKIEVLAMDELKGFAPEDNVISLVDIKV